MTVEDGKGIAFKTKDWEFGISRIPTRKRWALYIYENGVIWPLAYFTSDKAADKGMAAIEDLHDIIQGVKK